MIRIIFFTAALFSSAFAAAQSIDLGAFTPDVQGFMLSGTPAMKLYHPGDQAIYNIQASSFNGTLTMTIASVTRAGVWLHEIVDVAIHHEELWQLVDPQTGMVKRYIKDGAAQAPPKLNDKKVIATREMTIAVPAGRFQTVYKKMLMLAEHNIAEQWTDIDRVPGFGFVKLTGVSEGYPFVAELAQIKVH